MALDVQKFSEVTKAEYRLVGKRYSSEETCKQAELTLAAYERYGAIICGYSFVKDDADLLKEARSQLLAAIDKREATRGQKKQTMHAEVAAIHDGKKLRGKARTLLQTVAERLRLSGETSAAAVRKIGAALEQTASSSDSAHQLAAQLVILKELWSDATITAAVKTRGGDGLDKQLSDMAANIRKATSEDRPRTLTQGDTEIMDILDGLIIQLCRSARRAARAAARDRGEEAIAQAFALKHLDHTTSPTKPTPAE